MKKYLAFVLALVMSLSLVACGGSSDSSDAAEEEAQPKITEAWLLFVNDGMKGAQDDTAIASFRKMAESKLGSF